MTLTRRLFAARLTGALALSAAAPAWASAPAAIRDVALAQAGGAVRVSLAMDRAASARTFFLDNPSRFVIDVADARWALDGAASGQGQGPGAGVITRYRYGQRPEGAARLVLDLEAPTSLVRQSLGGPLSPNLSFDLASSIPTQGPVPLIRPQPGPNRSGRVRTVVIDPGHGGHDPGAIGAGGTREKDVVLDAALKLRSALQARGGYQVQLTRTDDTFVPLEDRVGFARAHNAELFISVHADSSPNNSNACGASVYTLSEHGAARAQNMMGAQNWDLDLGDAPRHGVVNDILIDLAQRETTNRSAQFAETVIKSLDGVSPLLANTHRNAGFFVLLAPDVPAVLIETGFLSNISDERRLSDPRAREAIADAMAGAVDVYFGHGAPIYMAGA
ncbi:MAG: N-acetylmuramoyl-L-alanine amidase [Alphaproteobacteria bacterium]